MNRKRNTKIQKMKQLRKLETLLFLHHFYLLSVFILLLLSCTDKKEKEYELKLVNLDSMSQEPQILATTLTFKQKDSLEEEVYNHGNDSAYRILQKYYFNYGRKEDFIEISKILANKYNNPSAQFSVYIEMLHLYKGPECEEVSVFCLPEDKKDEALTYLRMAAKNKYNSAVSEYYTVKREEMVK